MPDSLPSSTEHTVVIQRPGALTYISLAFNALILLLILIAIVRHHDKPPLPPRDRGADEQAQAFDRGERFGHHGFGGMRREWKHRDFADRDGGGAPDGDMPREGRHRDFGMDMPHDWNAPGDMGEHQPPSAEAMTDHFMLALTDRLTLTDEESAQIRPIVQQGIAQFQKDVEAQKEAHQKMIDDAKTKIRATLTPDQQKEFDAMTAQFGGPPASGK